MIPNVPRAELYRRYEKILPLVLRRGKVYQIRREEDIIGQSYTWDPEILCVDEDRPVVGEITTYHAWGYYGMFKPSIGEVLAQIPDDLLDKVAAFAIMKWPETRDDMFDGGENQRILNLGFHTATTRLFGQAATTAGAE